MYKCIYMGVDQNVVAGVLLKMTLRTPLRFLALFRIFFVLYFKDKDLYLIMDCPGYVAQGSIWWFQCSTRFWNFKSSWKSEQGKCKSFTESLVYWFPWWRCSCKKKTLVESNTYKTITYYYHDRNKEMQSWRPDSFSFYWPKVAQSYGTVNMLLPLPCSEVCPTWRNDLKRNLRLRCATLAFKTDFATNKI